MNEIETLRTLREDIPAPTADRLAPAFRTLEAAMTTRTRRLRAPRARWVLATAAGGLLVCLIAGNITVDARSASAASLLRSAAADASNFIDPSPGPGQYLLAHTHARWPVSSAGSSGDTTTYQNEQIIDVYVPADPSADWVLYRDWGSLPGLNGNDSIETMAAKDGEFYGGPWLSQELRDIPLGGAATLAYFDAAYSGGSASRDEDNFVRIVDLLRSGLVPAELRASLFEALALIPGVTSTGNVENLDGEVGVAIGRTEALRFGSRQEIILDPETGLVIGERSISGLAVFGFGFNEVMSLTAVKTSVADAAP